MPDTPPDFFAIWRTLLQQWETQTNAALVEAARKEPFGREMNRGLSAGLQLQAAFNAAVEKHLAILNLPSRAEVAALSVKLDTLERKIDALAQPGGPSTAPPTPKVRRTRRPPADPTP